MRNLLLSALAEDEISAMRKNLTKVELRPHDVIYAADSELNHVHFVEEGLVSVLAMSDGRCVEAALVGLEGMIGTPALLGQSSSPYEAVVRVRGTAWRMPVTALRQALDETPHLLATLLQYVNTRLVQAGETIFATGRCTVDQRLARWLLMAQERLRRDDIELTHECLASTLGVRRPGVTVALHILEGERAIRSRRGRITVLDRVRLQALAGPAFGSPPVVPKPALAVAA